ncbi:hypothetical protein HK097_003180 [Rhizophlyctis rosea]|uniref:Uncharacterized protein n=1 Tax=Rhizophlyctis rosea TaxID=64517 RepID=A0AAD5WY08_9FUNG|nr:hypothetical protein HK097_003180 [Rhizophlyctis rosea]
MFSRERSSPHGSLQQGPHLLDNSVLWSEVTRYLPLRTIASVRRLSRFHASTITSVTLACHAANALYNSRGRFALYDVEIYFRSSFRTQISDSTAAVLVTRLLEKYKLAPPVLPLNRQTTYWRKRKANSSDSGGVFFEIDRPNGCSYSYDPVYWMDHENLSGENAIVKDDPWEWRVNKYDNVKIWRGTKDDFHLAVCANHALCRAARWGLCKTAEVLIKHGACITTHGNLPLLSAAWAGHDHVVRTLMFGDLVRAKLGTRKLKLNIGRELFYAASKGHLSCVRIFVEAGVLFRQSPDHRKMYNCVTAAIARQYPKHEEVALYLLTFLQRYPKLWDQYINPIVPTIVAKSAPKILEKVLENGAPPYYQNQSLLRNLDNPEKFRMLVDKTEAGYHDLHYVLMQCVVQAQRSLVKMVLPKCTKEMMTAALTTVVGKAWFEWCEALLGIAEDLISFGADVGELPVRAIKMLFESGCAGVDLNPTHWLLKIGDRSDAPDLIRYFHSLGADVDAGDEEGVTPLVKALLSGEKGVARVLLECGAGIDLCWRGWVGDLVWTLKELAGMGRERKRKERVYALKLALFRRNALRDYKQIA